VDRARSAVGAAGGRAAARGGGRVRHARRLGVGHGGHRQRRAAPSSATRAHERAVRGARLGLLMISCEMCK
jgi:hypothetical protein